MPREVTTTNFYPSRAQRIARAGLPRYGRTIYNVGRAIYRHVRGNRRNKKYLPPTEYRGRPTSAVSGPGGGNRGLYRHRKKTKTHLKRKTVKAVKDIVNNVLSKNNSTGRYIKRYTCELGIPADNSQVVTQTFLRDGVGFVGGEPSCGISEKILDAVSVLFNGKTKAMDYTIATNNFVTQTLKFHIQYMSCKYVIQNQTDQTFHFDLYSGSHKGLGNDTIYTDFTNGLGVLKQSGGSTVGLGYLGVLATQIPSVNKNWNIKRASFDLKPGEYKTLFYKTHQDTLVDFEKLMDTTTLQNFTKLSQSLCFSYYNTMNRNILTSAAAVGHFLGSQVAKNGINIEVEEKYVMDAPADTTELNDVDNYCWFNDFPAAKEAGSTTHSIISNYQAFNPAQV